MYAIRSYYAIGNGSESKYQIVEPELTPDEKQVLLTLRRKIKPLLSDRTFHSRLLKNFTAEFHRIARDLNPELDDETIQHIAYYINRDARGFGKIHVITSYSIHYTKLYEPWGMSGGHYRLGDRWSNT